MSKAIAFDVGGTNSRIALFDDGKIVWRDEAPTPGQSGPEAVMACMAALHRPLRGMQVPVGVAFAGTVVAGRASAHNSAILSGWNDYPLEAALSSLLEKPVRVANDARAAAWGEYCFGAGKGCGEFLFITVSTGVGAGLVLNGRLHLARNGFDAELGETIVAGGGTLENHASGSALSVIAARHGYASGKALCNAADGGDSNAEMLYRHGIREIAGKLADIAVMLGIGRVAVGGGLGLRPGYLDRLREEMAKFPPMYRCDLVHAELGHDAGLYGVAALATENGQSGVR